MKSIVIPFGQQQINLEIPDHADVLSMKTPQTLSNPQKAIAAALANPIGCQSFDEMVREKMKKNARARAVIVVSDHTRPVPYQNEAGILWPLVEKLLNQGLQARDILILVATGTHRAMTLQELKNMLDYRIFEAGVEVKNHDCKREDQLQFLGTTSRGGQIYINKTYLEREIKILTGLVESHFMAGASGGRKAVCPGIIGEHSTYIFHGASILADPGARDLNLDGNPCHEEAVEFARQAGVDFIVNVTLDHNFKITGVFAGDLIMAHEAAVKHLKSYTSIPVSHDYDAVISHGGFVGINHYQCAKAGVIAASILKKEGHLLIFAHNSDTDVIGSLAYRTVLQLQKLIGAENCEKLLLSNDWTFIPEQWQVQMWGKLFNKIPLDHFHYYSPQFKSEDYQVVPGQEGRLLIKDSACNLESRLNALVKNYLVLAAKEQQKPLETLSIAVLKDGPYGIPLRQD